MFVKGADPSRGVPFSCIQSIFLHLCLFRCMPRGLIASEWRKPRRLRRLWSSLSWFQRDMAARSRSWWTLEQHWLSKVQQVALAEWHVLERPITGNERGATRDRGHPEGPTELAIDS